LEDSQAQTIPETTTDSGTEGEPAQDVAASEEKPKPVDDQVEIRKELQGLEKKVSAFQSEKDRAVQDTVSLQKQLTDTQRKLRAAESTLKGLSGDYSEDPDFEGRLDGHQLRSKLKAFEEREEGDRKKQETDVNTQRRVIQLKEDIKELGVDPSDPRLNEVAKGARGIEDLERRLRKEALNIAKGDSKRGSVDNKLDELNTEIANLKKRLGEVGNEGLPPQSGSVNSSDSAFLERFNSGELNSPADIKRAQKIIS